jgi:hypothetical protein
METERPRVRALIAEKPALLPSYHQFAGNVPAVELVAVEVHPFG